MRVLQIALSRPASALAALLAGTMLIAAGCGTGDGTLATATPTPTPTAPVAAPALGWDDELAENGKLNVVSTVAPISSVIRNIGGTRINLRGVIPDGVDSHTFEPAPSDAAILAQADILFFNGLHLEVPTEALARANLKEGAEIISLGDLTLSREGWKFDFSFPEDEGNPNPHLWPDVMHARKYAEIALDVLQRRDRANADYYRQNWERYDAKLQQLHEAIAEAVETIPEGQRKLLTYHDSFAYFAERYGMTVIGAIQPSDFSEPNPRDVADLIKQIREEKVPAIFGSEVFPSPVLEQIASETGATFVDEVRDDEPPGDPRAPEHTYIGMMLRNMELIVPALGGTLDALEGITPDDTYLP